jgi:hypothetical protein
MVARNLLTLAPPIESRADLLRIQRWLDAGGIELLLHHEEIAVHAAEPIAEPSAKALIHAGWLALSSYHSRGLLISPPTPSQHFPFVRPGLFLFQPVALRTKPIDVVQHPIQQRFGRRRWNACSLELPNLTALAMDLDAHTLDLGPNVFDIRHWSRLAK